MHDLSTILLFFSLIAYFVLLSLVDGRAQAMMTLPPTTCPAFFGAGFGFFLALMVPQEIAGSMGIMEILLLLYFLLLLVQWIWLVCFKRTLQQT
jgi:hypothetical protein